MTSCVSFCWLAFKLKQDEWKEKKIDSGVTSTMSVNLYGALR